MVTGKMIAPKLKMAKHTMLLSPGYSLMVQELAAEKFYKIYIYRKNVSLS